MEIENEVGNRLTHKVWWAVYMWLASRLLRYVSAKN